MTITNDFNIFANNYHKQNGRKEMTITDLADDILEIIKYKTIDMNREIADCDKEGGKYWYAHGELFNDVLDDIEGFCDCGDDEDGPRGFVESWGRQVFNYLYWDEKLTPVAYEKEHKRIYPHEDIIYEDNLIDDLIE